MQVFRNARMEHPSPRPDGLDHLCKRPVWIVVLIPLHRPLRVTFSIATHLHLIVRASCFPIPCTHNTHHHQNTASITGAYVGTILLSLFAAIWLPWTRGDEGNSSFSLLGSILPCNENICAYLVRVDTDMPGPEALANIVSIVPQEYVELVQPGTYSGESSIFHP